MSKSVLCLIMSMALAACAGLPASGPTTKRILEASASPSATSSYEVVDITPQVADIASGQHRRSSGRFARLGGTSSRGIGVGDSVAVTIFEASAGGLFGPEKTNESSSGAPRLNLPVQVVDRSGSISVPYAGAIPVAGRSPQQVQKTIERRLAKRAIEPQAIVTVVSNESRLVTVTGDVEKGGRFPLSTGSERVLDALALSGGPRGAPHDTYVKLSRGSQSAEILLQRLVDSSTDNVKLQAGDQIFVSKRPQRFVALGASTTSSEIDFAAEQLTLAQAIARAGGLDDRRADPAGVFVFRYEDAGAYAQTTGHGASGSSEPIVYRLNMKQPDSLLSAQRFLVRDKDVVYFANSPSTELSKFLGLLGAGVGVTNSGSATVVRVVN